jgi:hypothetical protein
MIRSMPSLCLGAARRSEACAASPAAGADSAGGSDGSRGGLLGVFASEGSGRAGAAGGRAPVVTPDRAAPELLNPNMNIGTGTNALRASTSSVRPRFIGPEEQDTRVVHAFDLPCMAIAVDYADFFSSCGALRSVTKVDFML